MLAIMSFLCYSCLSFSLFKQSPKEPRETHKRLQFGLNTVICSVCFARVLLLVVHILDDRSPDMDLIYSAFTDIMFYFRSGILAPMPLLCILYSLLTKHKNNCQSGGMDYQRHCKTGECQNLPWEPEGSTSSGASAICSKVPNSRARKGGRHRTHATLAVRLFMVFSGIRVTMGQTDSLTVMQVPYASQLLYIGLVAAVAKYTMRWRAQADQTSVTVTAFILFILSFSQIGLLWFSLDRKDNDMLNVIHTTGPAPILPPLVALWLYPIGYERTRSKYRRRVAHWDRDPGSMVRLCKLLNAWYKWVIYIAATAVVWAYGLILFLKTDNVYPLFSSVVVLALSSVVGVIPMLSRHIEELQDDCKDNCHPDVVTIPIIGSSRSTSFILLHFDWKAERMRFERVHSIVDHSDWGRKDYALLYDVAGDGLMSKSEFTTAAFFRCVKAYCKIVRRVGGWHYLSEKTVRMSGQIMDALEECPYMHEGHLRLFLFIRAVMTTTFLAGASRHKLLFHLKQDSVDSVATFIEDVTMGKVKNGFEIMCSDGKPLGSDDADALLRKFTDRSDRDVAAMLLLQMAAISGDNRVYIADTLADGSDVYLDYSFRTKTWSYTTLSKNRLLENPNCATSADVGGVYDVFKKSSAQGLSGKSHQERPSADSVPTTLTTFKILRQHIMKYLVGYMGLSTFFIAFGESFN
ncbi:unnamed protein product [Ostreobium quekettii]|uniref:THH1/TOM1/TOM3 domain-containing protein n=1 Tax=Ostreobium quekettii TaxID=121088 RepID=A0A8S1J504_9CHLO|nr:unnamed protein product [Ostreobium quekettii]